MSKYTSDGEVWKRRDDNIIIDTLGCGYDHCGEEGPIVMNAPCLIEMLEELGYDLSEVEMKK
jgi:hypothetical protein